MLRRQSLSLSAARYVYMYTEEPLGERKGFSLVKFNKETGQEEGRVWVDKRRPDYSFDPISGFVFVKENSKEIFALRFPPES